VYSNTIITIFFFQFFIFFNVSSPLFLVGLHLFGGELHSGQELSQDVEVGHDDEIDEADLASRNIGGLAIAQHRYV
jgi:hypothetical protein